MNAQLAATIRNVEAQSLTAISMHQAARAARLQGQLLSAVEEDLLDAAYMAQQAGELAGRHGLDMPACLDQVPELVDLFQLAATQAWEEANPGRLH